MWNVLYAVWTDIHTITERLWECIALRVLMLGGSLLVYNDGKRKIP